MKTKNLFLCAVMALFVCAFIAIPFTTVRADEIEITPIEDVETIEAPVEPSEDLETIKDKLNALMGKYNAEIETGKNFFLSRVLPALIASAVSTLIGVLFGNKARKSRMELRTKYNEVASAYNELEKRFSDYKKEKEIENTTLNFCKTDLLAVIEKQAEQITELTNELNKIAKKQDRLIAGAGQAWAECPDAVKAILKDTDNE